LEASSVTRTVARQALATAVAQGCSCSTQAKQSAVVVVERLASEETTTLELAKAETAVPLGTPHMATIISVAVVQDTELAVSEPTVEERTVEADSTEATDRRAS
jgi:Ethanolamine utilization protein EutJ (predicted chaperonin)